MVVSDWHGSSMAEFGVVEGGEEVGSNGRELYCICCGLTRGKAVITKTPRQVGTCTKHTLYSGT